MKKLPFLNLLILASLFLLVGCGDDDDDVKVSGTFDVTIENVFEGKDFFENGTIGFIEPGNSETYTFNAGKGHHLSFATMFVQTNDLFYAPAENGLALYNADGTALTGDITDLVDLWDAGTEVNEEPGTGPNQAPRQSGPNTGADENGTVELIENINDGYTYPANNEIIRATLTHDGGTLFTLTIENISNTSSLPTPFAPGVWAVHAGSLQALFTEGAAASAGLEGIAEDGNNEATNNDITSRTGLVSPFAPGAYEINEALFIRGNASSPALEALAEDGDASGYTNVFNTPVGASAPAPIFPGESYTFSVSAEDGDALSLATMLVQSNDWIVAANNIPLFENGIAISGDITSQFKIYDTGTEVDEYAGAGNDQAPRQSGPNTGADENGTVELESDLGDHVPGVTSMIRITVSSN